MNSKLINQIRKFLYRIGLGGMLLSLVFGAIGLVHAAPLDTQPVASEPDMRVIQASYFGISEPLSAMNPIAPDPNAPSHLRTIQDRLVIPKTQNGLQNGGRDPSIVQDGPVGNSMPALVANFEGVGNINGVLPPDTQGDIGADPATGKKYYVQWVNLSFQIWDVTNPATPISVYGPAAGNTLWTGLGTLCSSNNDGDPITMFDHLANRWVMSQFALSFPNNFHQCIAVSASADPTGAWYRYDFQTSTTLMNDYPHLGVWPDGYYMTVNQFKGANSAWAGAGVAVFERTAMLSGSPSARLIYINTGAVTLNYGGMLPSDLDGPSPVADTPNYFMEWDDSTWIGDPADTLRIWKFHTDWVNPANTTFGLNTSYDPNLKISTANVDPNMCSNCIQQPGTAQGLDAIADRLMHRLQYRNFGSYQTIVGNHTVDSTSTDIAGIHWFELRNTGSGFAMYQEGVYAPDSNNRWMGSAAMDALGDMALGYSVSSSTTYPSIRYTGRISTDPLNILPQGEASLVAGSGSQTHSAARWGDYSAMQVDPSDGCTFWYTQEYIQTTGSSPWQTRIGSFKFPSCTSGPTGILSGTVRDGASAPIAGARIDVSGGYVTTANPDGTYELSLVAGTYGVTASKYGYVSSTASGVVVTPPGTTTQNFTLALAPTYTISGVVTDTTTGWPLYARLDIFGYPGSPVFTNPVTGAYHVHLVNGPYTFTGSAMSGSYTPAVLPLDVSGDAIHNFGLSVDALTCSAPGYEVIPGTVILTDGFDTSTAPAFSASWAVADVSGTGGDWVTRTSSIHPTGILPYSAPNMAVFNSWTSSSGQTTRLYRTSGLNLSSYSNAQVSLWMYHDTGYSNPDSVQVQVSTNAGATWNNVGAPIARYDGTTGWAKHSVNINAYTGVGMSDVRIGLLGISAYGNDIHVEDVAVTQADACNPITSSGLVIGAVFDVNTSLPVPNASVKDVALHSALMIDASADPATPDQMYVIAQHSGSQNLTASAISYGIDTRSPTVVAGGTVGQDFHLPAGNLSASPTSLSYNVSTIAPNASKPLTLINTGGPSANYKVFAIPGAFAGYIPTGPFADHTRHTGPKNLNDLDTKNLRIDLTPQNVPLIDGGTISASWPTSLAYAWGIGFNTDANDLWLGNITAGGGDDLDYRFTTAGIKTTDTIDTSPWAADWGGDMTYNPFTNKLWQVNVGGDNCIYELDPATKSSTGNKICPAFGTSERGLAFDPLTSTYYAGSWNDGIINHFAPDGTLLDSAAVGLNTSGLAFNPSTGHLFVLTNIVHSTSVFDIYVLDTKNAYNILGAFNITDAGVDVLTSNGQAGLELDCAGNLWVADQNSQIVYKADSGETGVCDWQASWLSTIPSMGGITGSGSAPLAANVDATGMATGTYQAYLRVVSDTPYNDVIVPVTLNLTSAISQSIPLVTGWNLVSFNLHPTSTAITDVLSSLGSNYDLVYAWDASGAHASAGNWMRYAPGIPGNTLSTLDESQGFWLRMTTTDTLEITGTAPTTTNISLSTNASGWNLVGYPSTVNRSLPSALADHGVTAYSLVYAYHASNTSDPWKRYAPGVPGNDLLELASGWGFWIKVTTASTWEVGY